MVFPVSILATLHFSSPWLLPWLVAVAIPLLILLLGRRRRRESSWAAIELLRSAMRQRARKVQFQQWLLLAVRMSIVATCILAAAGLRWRTSPLAAPESYSIEEGRTHHLLLIDQSYSMSCKRSGETRIERAQSLARQMVESAPRGDLFTIIGWANRAENILGRPTSNRSAALQAISKTAWLPRSANLESALDAAARAIELAAGEGRASARQRTIWLTDLARNTWQPQQPSWDLIQKRLYHLSQKGELLVWDTRFRQPHNESQQPKQPANVAITHLAARPSLATTGRPITCQATLHSFGAGRPTPRVVTLSIDGIDVASQQVELPAGGEVTISFTHRIDKQGWHAIRVSATSDRSDPVAVDDQRWLAVEVREQTRVACIAGKPGGADDLIRALNPRLKNPRGNSSAWPNNPIYPEAGPIVGSTQLATNKNQINVDLFPASRLEEVELFDYDAVFLCNLAEMTQQTVDRLDNYVRLGGQLIVMLGDRVSAERYERLAPTARATSGPPGAASSAHGLLPARLGAPVTGSFHFDPLEYQHPIVHPFRNHENSGLLSVAIRKYFPLTVDSNHDDVVAALALDTGDPAILIGPSGLGRVVLVALPGSLASRTDDRLPWSSWAVSPSFLPLVRELHDYLVGMAPLWAADRLVGEPLLLPPRRLPVGQDLVMRIPENRHPPMNQPSAGKAPMEKESVHLPPALLAEPNPRFTETGTAGIYSLHAAGRPEQQVALYAVNLDTQESDLQAIEPESLPPLFQWRASAETTNAIFGQSAAEFALETPLLLTALVLLLIELILAWWISREWG
jgi:aerotolerance regulator-like protein/VWA domain-containing protein